MKKNVKSTISWFTAVVVVILLLNWLDFAEAFLLIRNASTTWLLLAVLLIFLGMFLRWLKWFVVLKSRYNLKDVTTVFFISKLAGSASPARVGELAPLVKSKYRNREIAALITVDRFFETYATLLLGAVGFTVIGFFQRWLVISWLVIFMGISVLFGMLIYKRFWNNIHNFSPKHPYITRLLSLIESVSLGMWSLKPWLSHLMLLSFVGTVVDFFLSNAFF